jgi:hypothetical protein
VQIVREIAKSLSGQAATARCIVRNVSPAVRIVIPLKLISTTGQDNQPHSRQPALPTHILLKRKDFLQRKDLPIKKGLFPKRKKASDKNS